MENIKNRPIVITGHPYAHPHYFKVFEYADKSRLAFVLPKVWKAKLNIKPEKKPGFTLFGLNAFSYGKKSLLGGPFKGWLPGLLYLLPYLRFKRGAKVLYSCSEPNLLTTLFNGCLAKLLGMKLVLFTWQNVEPEKRMRGLKFKLSNLLVRFNLRLADGIICGNRKAEEIVEHLAHNSKCLTTLVCPLSGVDTEKFKPGGGAGWKERLNIGVQKMILFYGVLDARKGVNILIKAFREISDKACLVIVGSGPQKDYLVALAGEWGLSGKVVFLNWMANSELPGLLNEADVFVYPSVPFGGWEEQFGYAMAEASACGIPVVATGIGAIGEAVKDGITGFLVPPNDIPALRGAITELLENPVLAEQMGLAGRSYIESNFSHRVIAEKISKFLNNFL